MDTVLPYCIIGLVLMGLLVGFSVYGAQRQRQRIKTLRAEGEQVIATITEVKSAYRGSGTDTLKAYWVNAEGINPLTGETQTFHSDTYGFKPDLQVGEPLTVWIDRRNPGRYAVDLDPVHATRGNPSASSGQ